MPKEPLSRRPQHVGWLIVAVMLTALPTAAQDTDTPEVEPPTRVQARDTKDLLRGAWAGTTVNGKGTSRTSTLTLEEGDFSAATGRFNNWKILRGEGRGRRGRAVEIALYAPGTQDGQPVEKPITCVGRFDDDYRKWTGEFRGFTQTGTFELVRQPAAPAADAVRGTWAGSLTPSRVREGDTPPPFTMNLLTGGFAQATGVVFLTPEHPAAETVEVLYFNPQTREIDLRITFAKSEDRRAKAAKSAEFQGVFDAEYTTLQGAYRATGHGGSGTFRLERR